ncbi:unnamed protein product [Caenorhabditis angaria]|uniref:Uncharacterized protein n=1 Tax=Caenorhabditis angaria TaxID=860376 RepID=A0A9P1N9B0_9PELO|nr:unnamed protein product [Caenorhabditis angaria]
MQGVYHFQNQPAALFGNIDEESEKNRYCKLHIQTWVYIHSGVKWHEKLVMYRLVLIYIRRANAEKYWIMYRTFFGCWILIHFIHMITIVITIFATQKSSTILLKPQLTVLILQVGLLILALSGIFITSITSKFTWDILSIVIFQLLFVSSNLILLTEYHRFLDEKLKALRELLLGQAKTVHFKDHSSSS